MSASEGNNKSGCAAVVVALLVIGLAVSVLKAIWWLLLILAVAAGVASYVVRKKARDNTANGDAQDDPTYIQKCPNCGGQASVSVYESYAQCPYCNLSFAAERKPLKREPGEATEKSALAEPFKMLAIAAVVFGVLGLIGLGLSMSDTASDNPSASSSSISSSSSASSQSPSSNAASSASSSSSGSSETAIAAKYELSGAELGKYGTAVVLNKDTDMPVEKRLYKLPAGKYTVTTTNDKLSSFFIVKDEVGIEEGNEVYPETLQYVGEEHLLTAGTNDFGGHAKKEVTIEIAADESILLPTDKDTIVAEEVLS
ncbi:MAG: hypothetical protein IJ111_03165 [Eggerthellaceae bacterium]|nr:hypothetical protein [Eggerthellaceae bacterium]